MNRVRVVTGYVPLTVKHMNPSEYDALGQRLIDTCAWAGVPVRAFKGFPYKDCWLALEDPPMRGANPRATDRFDTEEQHAKSNVVCNQFVEWGWKSYKEDPLVDVIVFMVYTVLRQGAFTGKPVQSDHIRDFFKRVEAYRFDDIPFPGITTGEPIDPNWHNWRFCGSTHIWPVRWLKEIRKCYKETALRTMKKCEAVPLDLAVWPQVEQSSGLPFRFYQAEYDATQFTNFPGKIIT